MTLDAQLRDLQELVLEKDELLKVLTERLELAAEQLDRLRRQGSVIEPAPHLAQPKPPQIDSPAVLEDLRQMLSDWQDLQSRDWFGVLEERLEGIHGTVSQLKSLPSRPVAEEKSGSSSVSDILAKYQTSERPASADAPADTDTAGSEEPAPTELVLPELPAPVDIEHGSTEELREALRQREEYISRLRDYLLAYDALHAAPIGGVDLESLSPEQQAAVEAWEAKVRKELRQTQIQLWVERAQLSREQMQLQQKLHHLDTETRRMGLTNPKAGAGSNTGPAGDDNPKSKNWLGLFGNK